MTTEEQIRAAVDAQVDPLIRKAAEERWRDDLWSYSRETADWRRKDAMEMLDQGEEYLRVVYGGTFPRMEPMLCFRSDRAEAMLQGSPSGRGLDLYDRLQDIFARIALAVNDSRDTDDYDRSYSKSLITALFKYGGRDSALIIKELNLNAISLAVAVNGEELPCHPFIHFNEVSNKRILEEKLREAIAYGAGREAPIRIGETDRIRFWFRGYTLDISQLDADQLDAICYSKVYEGRKWCASYRADQEVLSDEPVSPEEKLSRMSTECVRLLALFKIFHLDEAWTKLFQYHANCLKENHLPTGPLGQALSYMCRCVWAMRAGWDDFCTKSEEKGMKYPRYNLYGPRDDVTKLLDQLFRQNILLTDEALYIYAKRLLTGSAEEA